LIKSVVSAATFKKETFAGSKKTPEQRFQDVASKHQESVQRHLQNVDDEYESSDEEEDMNDDDILESVLKSFRGSTGEAVDPVVTHETIDHICSIIL